MAQQIDDVITGLRDDARRVQRLAQEFPVPPSVMRAANDAAARYRHLATELQQLGDQPA